MAEFTRKNNQKKGTKNAPKTERPQFDFVCKVTRVLDGKYGVLFDMEINHVTVYGCRVCETRDGSAFVGFPQKKDRDGDRYWSIVYAPLSDAQTADVLKQVSDMLDAESEGEE